MNYKYKKTEIGEIPAEWEVKSFDDTFKVLNSNTFSRDNLNYTNGSYKNVHYGDVLILFDSFVNINDNKVPFINNDLIVKTTKLKTGDIIFADTAEDETVGKAVEVINDNEINSVSGLHTILCREKGSSYSKFFLGYFFNSKLFHNQLLQYITGTKVCSISKSDIKKTYVVIPKIEEQEKIVKCLRNIDNEIVTLEKIIKKKQYIKETVKKQILGYGKDNGTDYKTYKISECFKIVNGFTPLRSNKEYWDNGTISWFTVDDIYYQGGIIKKTTQHITNKALGNSTSRLLPPNTLLICCTASIGMYALTEIEMVTNQQFNGLILKKEFNKLINPKFMYYIAPIIKKQLLDLAGKTTISFVSTKQLGDIDIEIPNIDVQNHIVDIIDSFESELVTLNKQLSKLKNMKTTILNDLITGKRRLSFE